ncbi:peptidylprolyl isomerase [Thermomonospora sp. CIF 1]|uniref:peptidylprolyl isomerase n=1 Tax=Thermomonospora sp. CIF 1 TaxID=1916083 RepID=UPI000A720C73|nr:peptidylprolyl isomerase [Thermomonospora sp. CIF 1]PKK15098.1 MAG: hypothetical protein BUE48_005935 [Thermomonospora sp. CIF 1]
MGIPVPSIGCQPGQATITMSLDAVKAPCAVDSMIHLAGRFYFDGAECHRLTAPTALKVLQCGDPTGSGRGGPGYHFADENLTGVHYTRGTVATANSGPDTNSSQLLIVCGYCDLAPNYTVLGHVTSGLDIIDDIAEAGVAVDSGLDTTDGRPRKSLTIERFHITSG